MSMQHSAASQPVTAAENGTAADAVVKLSLAACACCCKSGCTAAAVASPAQEVRLAALHDLHGRPEYTLCSKIQVCDCHLRCMSMKHTAAAAAKPVTAAKIGTAADAVVTLSIAACCCRSGSTAAAVAN